MEKCTKIQSTLNCSPKKIQSHYTVNILIKKKPKHTSKKTKATLKNIKSTSLKERKHSSNDKTWKS